MSVLYILTFHDDIHLISGSSVCMGALSPISHRLLSLGYSWYDETKDSEYIQRLAQNDPDEFEEFTGYHMPDHVDHIVCEACRYAHLMSVN